MRGAGFGPRPLAQSLAFAVFAGLGAVVWILLAEGTLGRPLAVSVYAALSAVLYLLTIASSWRAAVRAAALAIAAMVLLLLTVPVPGALLLGAAGSLAVARSGLLHRSTPGRALVIEFGLLALGALFARWLYGSGHLGPGLAFWGFYLVQSLFPLIGDPRPVRGDPETDPFDQAMRRMEELLERG